MIPLGCLVGTAPGTPTLPTVIGEPALGGFYAGIIDTTQPGAITASDQYQTGQRYLLIVAPKSLEISDRSIAWRTTRRGTNLSAQTRWNGLEAQEAYAYSEFPAFNYCYDLPYPNDGGSRWYVPAMDELELCYRNLKPSTNDNLYLVSNVNGDFPSFSEGLPSGQNPSSDPQGTAYTATVPGQTPVTNFQYNQPEYFGSSEYWTSTWCDDSNTWTMNLGWGEYRDKSPDSLQSVRPVRRYPIPPTLDTAGDFESIATVTVGSGGASSIEFTSIPGTYQHLQVRGLLRQSSSSASGRDSPSRSTACPWTMPPTPALSARHRTQSTFTRGATSASVSNSKLWVSSASPTSTAVASSNALCKVGCPRRRSSSSIAGKSS